MTVWRLMAHHEHPDDMLRWALMAQRLAIGWGHIGNLSTGRQTSPESIKTAIREHYPQNRNASPGGQCLWDFWQTMREGDLVILNSRRGRKAVMRVAGPYEYIDGDEASPVGDYFHQRPSELLTLDPDRLWERAGGRPPHCNLHSALIRCPRQVSGP